MQIEQIDAFRHRIARDETRGMRTDVVVYASAPLMQQILNLGLSYSPRALC